MLNCLISLKIFLLFFSLKILIQFNTLHITKATIIGLMPKIKRKKKFTIVRFFPHLFFLYQFVMLNCRENIEYGKTIEER